MVNAGLILDRMVTFHTEALALAQTGIEYRVISPSFPAWHEQVFLQLPPWGTTMIFHSSGLIITGFLTPPACHNIWVKICKLYEFRAT